MEHPLTPGTGAVTAPVPGARRRGELAFIGVILAFSLAALVMTGFIREPAGSSNVLGARVLPYAINGLMLLASVGAFVAVLRGDIGAPDEGEDIDADAATSWRTVGIVGLAFGSLTITIPLVGWPAAVTILFAGAALALGSGSWWKSLLIGAGLGAVTQLLFGQLLGLSLPPFGTTFTGAFGG